MSHKFIYDMDKGDICPPLSLILFDNFIFCGYSNVSDEPYSRFLLNSPQYSLQSTFYSLFPHGSVIKL